MVATGIDFLAAGIGNIHGPYPANWEGLDLDHLKKLTEALPGFPIVLHGGSGIPDEQIKEAIKLGVAKVTLTLSAKSHSLTQLVNSYVNTMQTKQNTTRRNSSTHVNSWNQDSKQSQLQLKNVSTYLVAKTKLNLAWNVINQRFIRKDKPFFDFSFSEKCLFQTKKWLRFWQFKVIINKNDASR